MQNNRTVARVYTTEEGGSAFDQGLLVIWFLVVGLPIEALSPLRYLFIAYFLSFFLFETRKIVNQVAAGWWYIPIQIVALLSFFWSDYPSNAMREGMLLLMSALIILITAARFTPQQVIRCLFLACLVIAAYIWIDPTPIWNGGPFGSKNYAALQMLTGFIVCFAVALNQEEIGQLRILAWIMAPVFAALVVLASSTTALLMLMISAAALLFLRLVFIDARQVNYLFSFILVLGLIVAFGILYGILAFVDQQVIDSFLGLFGKDSSFTGRTNLWVEAQNQISQKPYLGVGLEGFWQYDVGAAQTLNEYDHKAAGTRLSFHNAHLEVLVHLGIVGYSAFLFAIIAVITVTYYRLFKRPDVPSIAFAVIIIISLISSFVESSLFGTFNIQAFAFFVGGALYSRRERRQHIGNLVIEPQT